MEDATLKKFKKKNTTKYDAPVLDSQLIKLNQTEFLKQLNQITAKKLAIKNRCPQKGETYNLKGNQILTKLLRMRGKSKYDDPSKRVLTYMDFKKYMSNFDTDMKSTQTKALIEKVNLTKQQRQKIRFGEPNELITVNLE